MELLLKTALNAGEAMDTKYLKPIDFFMIVLTEGKEPRAIVLANEIVSYQLEKLIKGSDNKELKHKAFLVTSSGKLVQRGHGILSPDEADVQRILKSQWLQDLVIDAALLRGQIAHPERLIKRLETWPAFESFWNRIVEAQPNPETANTNGMKLLLEGMKRGK